MNFPPRSTDYAFTEIKSFRILPSANIETSQIWANTLRAYVSHAGVRCFWWGRLLEEQQVVKLIIERAHAGFAQSQDFQSMQASWIPLTADAGTTSFYHFNAWAHARNNVFTTAEPEPSHYFSTNIHYVTAMLAFHLLPSFDPNAVDPLDEFHQPQGFVIENAWNLFSSDARVEYLKTEIEEGNLITLSTWPTARLPPQQAAKSPDPPQIAVSVESSSHHQPFSPHPPRPGSSSL
ncbi:hypothetical protein CC80DRAFT_585688 [Byssothecium circinans]|uniref:Uncharacterized protein n=1 Tax=Byssothecium circinans TaxID=147558 RepID=A0A6A5U3M4_9PLEO|nr:hypothetical protein CC80DRAFT_585688 [Byssothecium circinans]